MASNIVFNGVTYSVPVVADDNWGPDLTAYLISIASNALQKTGGTFTLTSEVNFGATYGIKTPYIKSQATNPSGTGAIRLGNLQAIAWRNAANTADLSLTADATDVLNFNGTSLSVGGTPVQTAITVSDTATIDMTLAGSDVSGIIVAGSVTNAHISSSAAIDYTKLNISAGAVAYSKLTLTGSVVNADISASAAIAVSKLAALTVSRALQTNSSTGLIEASSVTNTELGYLSGVTSSIQTQLGTKVTNPMTAGGDIIYGGASGLPTRLANGSAGNILQSTGGTSAPAWSTAAYPTTTTAKQILYSSAANIIGEITTGNTSALVTNSSGVPSFALGTTANRVLRTDGTTVAFSSVSLSTDVVGVAAIANGGTNNGSLAVTAGGAVYTDGTRLQTTAAGTSGQVLTSNGASAPTWQTASGSSVFVSPTIQKFISGSGNYTTPANVLYMKVRLVGGGGGGASSGTGSTNGGVGGTASSFGSSLLVANGGAGGGTGSPPGAGGTASLGAAIGLAIAGQGGNGNPGTAQNTSGGSGGSSALGGGGNAAYASGGGAAGGNAATNSGSGGAGATGATGISGANGGGAGGFVDAIIYPTALQVFPYVVGAGGAGGAAGTGGAAGGNAAAGIIIVEEHYQ